MQDQETLIRSVLQGRHDFFSSLNRAFFEDDERIFYFSGLDSAPCNGVLEKTTTPLSEKTIDLALHFFRLKKVPFVWWSDDKLLKKKGFQFSGIQKGITLPLSNIQHPQYQAFTKIVETEKECEIFCKIVMEVFGLGSHNFPIFLELLQKSHHVNFLGYFEDKPVATLTLATSHLSASLWNGATLPSYRKKGMLTALLQRAVFEAKKRQYEHVTAILMENGMASTVTQTLGFKEVCEFYTWSASLFS